MTATLFLIGLLCSLTTLASCCIERGKKTVSCSGSHLSSIPENINKAAVESLILSNNALKVVDNNALVSYSDLRSLYLDRNKITVIEKRAIGELISLRHLDLSDNQITHHKSDTFSSNTHLQTLSLSGNHLQKWLAHHGTFLVSMSLTTLDLSRNRLTSLHLETFQGLPSLENIDLRSNSLSSLPTEIFGCLDNLSDVFLAGNPWKCDEDFLLLVDKWKHVIKDRHLLASCFSNMTSSDEAPPSNTRDTSSSTQAIKISTPSSMVPKSSISSGYQNHSISAASSSTDAVTSTDSSERWIENENGVQDRENKSVGVSIPVAQQDNDHALYGSLIVTSLILVMILVSFIVVFIVGKKKGWFVNNTERNEYIHVQGESVHLTID